LQAWFYQVPVVQKVKKIIFTIEGSEKIIFTIEGSDFTSSIGNCKKRNGEQI